MRKAIIGDDVSAVALAEADGIDTLIKKSYKLLGLATYFTTGEKETRAWTIKAGSTAPVAAAAIHTDFEKKFIRADEVDLEPPEAAEKEMAFRVPEYVGALAPPASSQPACDEAVSPAATAEYETELIRPQFHAAV
jgi:hypothetical protein